MSERGPWAWLDRLEQAPLGNPQAALDRLRCHLNDYARGTPRLALEPMLSLRDPLFLADFVAAHLPLSMQERRALLEEPSPEARVARVCEWLQRELLEPSPMPRTSRTRLDAIRFLSSRENKWGAIPDRPSA